MVWFLYRDYTNQRRSESRENATNARLRSLEDEYVKELRDLVKDFTAIVATNIAVQQRLVSALTKRTCLFDDTIDMPRAQMKVDEMSQRHKSESEVD